MYKYLFMLLVATTAYADPALEETRYCGQPLRNTDGSIHRRSDVIAAFKRLHPCPATLKTVGACPGWQANHVVPLACGGCDAVSNLVWVPTDIKTCSQPHCVDRYERRISAATPPLSDTAACVNVVVP